MARSATALYGEAGTASNNSGEGVLGGRSESSTRIGSGDGHAGRQTEVFADVLTPVGRRRREEASFVIGEDEEGDTDESSSSRRAESDWDDSDGERTVQEALGTARGGRGGLGVVCGCDP